jgi:predicted negative regulator of RcsB-dependent stress response
MRFIVIACNLAGRMFLRVRIITVVVCVGMGFAPHLVFANSLGSAKDLFSSLRSYKNPVTKNEGGNNGASAASHHRLAKTYVDQNDIARANAYFSSALQNATVRQMPGIAVDYAALLMNTGDLRKAELILRQALSQSPNDEALIRMLARCLVQQEKVMEGLRYFRSIMSEAESRREVAAIYQEQGNADMLAVVEKRWGNTGITRPETVREEPALIAATPKPVVVPVTVPSVGSARASTPSPATQPSVNTAVTDATIATPTVARTAQTLPPTPTVVTSRRTVTPTDTVASNGTAMTSEDVAIIAATPITSPLSKSEFFDTRVPIPVPNAPPQTMITMAMLPKPASSSAPKLPAPMPTAAYASPGKLALVNPVRLPAAPKPALVLSEKKEPPRPTVVTRTSRHYVINAGSATNVDTMFPIQPTVATVLLR